MFCNMGVLVRISWRYMRGRREWGVPVILISGFWIRVQGVNNLGLFNLGVLVRTSL